MTKYLVILFSLIFGSMACFANQQADVSQHVDDGLIKTKILLKYSQEPLLNPLRFDVKVKNGDVVLRGKVNKSTQKKKATELANATSGVRHVDSKEIEVMDKSWYEVF